MMSTMGEIVTGIAKAMLIIPFLTAAVAIGVFLLATAWALIRPLFSGLIGKWIDWFCERMER